MGVIGMRHSRRIYKGCRPTGNDHLQRGSVFLESRHSNDYFFHNLLAPINIGDLVETVENEENGADAHERN